MRYSFLLSLVVVFLTSELRGSDQDPVILPVRSLPKSLAPNTLRIATDNFIFRQISEGLFGIGDGFKIVPKLAKRYAWSRDSKKLTIEVRNASFSDGTPLNAAVVVSALQRCVLESKNTFLSSVEAIDGFDEYVNGKADSVRGIKVASLDTVEVTFTRPAPLVLDDLAQAECHIVKPAKDGSFDFIKGALGIGPYKISRISSDELALDRSEHYYQQLSGPRKAIYRKTDDFGNFANLKGWVSMATLDALPEQEASFTATPYAELGSYQLVFNNSRYPFNKKSMRQAVTLGIDFALLATALGWENERLQAGLIPFGMAGFKRRSNDSYEMNIRRARALLAKEGFTQQRPLVFTILLSSQPSLKKEVALWPKIFERLPITVKVEVLPHSEVVERNNQGEFEAIRVTKYPGSVEAHRLLASYLSGSKYNIARSNTPICDKLTKIAVEGLSRFDRLKGYSKAEKCLIEEAILVPLASLPSGYVMMKRPWKLGRTNRYLLYPYWIAEWRRE